MQLWVQGIFAEKEENYSCDASILPESCGQAGSSTVTSDTSLIVRAYRGLIGVMDKEAKVLSGNRGDTTAPHPSGHSQRCLHPPHLDGTPDLLQAARDDSPPLSSWR